MGRGHASDEQLVKMIKSGGDERRTAMAQIYETAGLRERIANYVSYHGGRKRDGVDVCAEAVIIVERNIRHDKFKGTSAISTYTYGVAKLYWANKSRIIKHSIIALDEIPTEFSDYQNPELIFMTQELNEKLDKIVNLLSEKCIKILKLWSNNVKYKEIAKELGVQNTSQLRKMKYDCQQKLKEYLLREPEMIPNYYNGESGE